MTSLSAPSRLALLGEVRVVPEALRMACARWHRAPHQLDTEPVMLLPGFGAGEGAMSPLARHLEKYGVQAEHWGLGKNLAGLDIRHTLTDISERWQPEPLERYRGEAGVAYLCDRMVERVQERSQALGSKLTLIGWSLGGTISREVARDLPEHVARVITLGSPVWGGPKYTAGSRRLAARGLDLDWIERQVIQRNQRPIQVPVTAIVSPSDGIVSHAATLDDHTPGIELRTLNISHLGMSINPRVWAQIIDVLDAAAQTRTPD
jgi:pimeloyl-ACP methyl ester carboxylesterase